MKKNKGITLIALVITIIVLLILAGVSIAMLLGENNNQDIPEVGKSDGSWDEIKGVNTPVLKDGMKLLKYNETTKDWVVDNTNKNYDYIPGTEDNNSSKWANARLNGNYYVWIPRYAYKIDNSVTYTSPSGGESHKIDVKFIENDVKQSNIEEKLGTEYADYIVHPAFTFGTKELPGIWVGKYETTGDAETPTILPNERCLRSINLATMFSTVQKLSTTSYNAHMMKNIEWGAVAYLAQSTYGRNGSEISINQCTDRITGAGRGEGENKIYNATYEWVDIIEEQKWNGDIGVLSSTTGNVYGVYDMAGSISEVVMGVYGTENNLTIGDSGFVTFPERKYYDLYTKTSIDISNIGDALYETNKWNNDNIGFITPETPFFGRGGGAWNTYEGGIFCAWYFDGIANEGAGCRACITVQ